MGRSHWDDVCRTAEALAAELSAAEAELLRRPDLHRRLAIPGRLRQALRAALHDGPTPAAVRVLRFDFHWTSEGWRISEVNSDVPGGGGPSRFCSRTLPTRPGSRRRRASKQRRTHSMHRACRWPTGRA